MEAGWGYALPVTGDGTSGVGSLRKSNIIYTQILYNNSLKVTIQGKLAWTVCCTAHYYSKVLYVSQAYARNIKGKVLSMGRQFTFTH